MFKSITKNKAPNILFLPGWRAGWQSWFPIIERLKVDFNIYASSLPIPTVRALTLDDYCQFTLNFIKKGKINDPIIAGHSLGGAIATKIATQYPKAVKAIVLAASASIRHQLPEPWLTLQRATGPIKPILRPFRNLALRLAKLDASDYLGLKTEIEKQTFRNLIAADLTPVISQIQCPTLILWGEDDRSTPIADGRKIHKMIKHSTFKSFPKTGHFFFLDYQKEVAKLIKRFVITKA